MIWRTQGNPGVVLVDGRLVATWRPKKTGKTLVMRVTPISPLGETVWADIEQEAQSLAVFRGCTTAQVQREEAGEL